MASTTISQQVAEPQIPTRFVCALSHQLMTDPILTVHGHNYQREAIIDWFSAGNTTCPITGKALQFSDVISNAALRSNIEFWIEEHNYSSVNVDRSSLLTVTPTKLGLFADQQEIDQAKHWPQKEDLDSIPRSIMIIHKGEPKPKGLLKRIFSKPRSAKAA